MAKKKSQMSKKSNQKKASTKREQIEEILFEQTSSSINRTHKKKETSNLKPEEKKPSNTDASTRAERYKNVAIFYDGARTETIQLPPADELEKMKQAYQEPQRNKGKKHRKFKFERIILVILLLALVLDLALMRHNFRFKKDGKEKVIVKKVYEKKPVVDDKIVFFGDSITYQYKLDEYFYGKHYINSGADGDNIKNLKKRVSNDVYKYEPTKVFVLIGTNDLENDDIRDLPDGKKTDEVASRLKEVIQDMKKNLPDTTIYIESVYPVNRKAEEDKISLSMVRSRENDDIRELNKKLEKLAKEEKVEFLNFYDALSDDEGQLKLDYTKEGLHLNDLGYVTVTRMINDAIEKTNEKAAETK